ncbi:adenylate kinase-domain-containing protein [Entophlyctis helioformis]|nr:adenylate kinase-domain-containing protein [Entophlyctis helioformis]
MATMRSTMRTMPAVPTLRLATAAFVRLVSTSASASAASASSASGSGSSAAAASATASAASGRTLRAVIMGCPGAGKGTQTQRLRAAFPLRTLSSGDVLRDNVARGTPAGLKAQAIIEAGGLVNDTIVNDLVFADVGSLPSDQSYILDGFPRTATQAEILDAWLQERGQALDMVINLDVPWSVILQRIEDRWIHAPSGRTYNLSYNPPKRAGLDDITGEPLTKRADDNVDVFRARLEAYQEQTMPLLEYYQEQGTLINFKGSTSDEIFPKIRSALASFFSDAAVAGRSDSASSSISSARFPPYRMA